MSEVSERPIVPRLLTTLIIIGVVLALGTLARGVWLAQGGVGGDDTVGDWAWGVGFIVLGMLPPLLGVFAGWRMLKTSTNDKLSRLLPKLGSLLSYTASLLSVYPTTLLNEEAWLDAQAGIVFLFLPLVGLALGALAALTGAIVGWTIAKAVGA